MSTSLTFHTPCSVDVSLCNSAALCVCCRHLLESAGFPNCSAVTSGFSFSLQNSNEILGLMARLARAHLTSHCQSCIAKASMPELTLLSVSLQSTVCVKTCASWRSQACPAGMSMPNVSDEAATDLDVFARYQLGKRVHVEYLLGFDSGSYSDSLSNGKGICEAETFGILFNTEQIERAGTSVLQSSGRRRHRI